MLTRRVRRLVPALLWTLLIILPLLVLPLLNRFFYGKDRELYMRGVCYAVWGRGISLIMGFRVKIDPPTKRLRRRGTLIVSNHMTFIDSMVLPHLINAVPVSRGDIENWPLLGMLSKMAGLIWVDRQDRRALGMAIDWMKSHLESGMNVSLYPEGTSTDGRGLLPFMSGLFKAAVDTGCPVIPVTVLATDRRGRSLEGAARSQVMWFADVEFGPHIYDFVAHPGVTYHIKVGEPLRAPDGMPAGKARKELSNRVFETISNHLSELNAEADAKLAAD